MLMPLLGNLFLFKMFVPEQESSTGGQMWFISTIIQFYIAWLLIVRLISLNREVLDSSRYQSFVTNHCGAVRIW